MSNFTTTIMVAETAGQVFDAINDVRGWWSEEIEGNTSQLNDEFDYHYEDVHRSRMKIVESIPGKKIAWLVMSNYFKFTADKTEWTGTQIIFEISNREGRTELRFTHKGLVPEYECYNICRDAWTNYIQNSLFNLITTGKGKPNGKGKPQTGDEKKLSENS
jgi:hypothetical protein